MHVAARASRAVPVSVEYVAQSTCCYAGVGTARPNQQFRRIRQRFQEDFIFALTASEYSGLMLQSATSLPHREE